MTHIYHQLPRRHKQLLITVCVITGLLFLLPSEDAKASKISGGEDSLAIATRYEVRMPQQMNDGEVGSAINLAQPTPANTATKLRTTHSKDSLVTVNNDQAIDLEPADKLTWQQVKVKSGDNLALIFSRAGFSATTLHRITSLGKATASLKKIMPGQIIHFGANAKKQLIKLTYQQDFINRLEIVKTDTGYQASQFTAQLETREKMASAVISSNFWNAGIEAGIEASLIMNLANIFGWDIDFALDIRKGDQFNIIYESKFLDGVEVKTGNILAAEFINQGQSYQAIRHTDGEYYSATGRSMRKAFLRTPVKFNYISSNFNPRRKHPVTGKIRAHNGIDYAAKRGTPVRAAGSGTVIASAYSKYNGNYVFIKHGEKYLTKYLHLTKKYVKKGAKVKQGQRIGTVGSTGRVTGAHLHYEFLVNGSHRNPRTVKLPKSQSLAKKQKAAFLSIANNRMAQLATNKRIMLASNE